MFQYSETSYGKIWGTNVYMESHERNRIVENRRFDIVWTKRRKTGLAYSKEEECSCHILRDNGTNTLKEERGE